jgi:hypothetical protein
MEASKASGLDQLRKAVISQKTVSLPAEEKDPDYQSLHKIVVDYDQYVSQMVIGVLSRNEEALSYPHRTLVMTAIEEVETLADQYQQRKVEQYRKYIQRLDHMHDLALQVSASDQG